MAKCSRCGKPVGLISKICDECKQAIAIEQRLERERLYEEKVQRDQQQLEEYKAYMDYIISSKIQALKQRIESGEKTFLYDNIYLPVDSKVVNETIAEEFSLGSLRILGLDGWDIIAVIPKTLGVALINESYGSSSGSTWGAGLGGNVVGVHIIIRKEFSLHSNVSDDFLLDYIERNLLDFATEKEIQKLDDLSPLH